MTLPLDIWGNRVLLREVGNEVVTDQASAHIVMPQNVAEHRQRYNRWEIAAVGDNVRDPALIVGAQVIARRWATQEIVWEGQRYRVAYDEDIIAVLTL